MIYVKKLDKDAKLPQKNESDLGYDIFANEDINIWKNGGPYLVSTGIAMQHSNPMMGFLVKDRSSMAVKGVFTHAGVIDPDYTGEIKIVMTFEGTSNNHYEIKKGDKIAQLIPHLAVSDPVIEVEELRNTERGSGGFGSTGG